MVASLSSRRSRPSPSVASWTAWSIDGDDVVLGHERVRHVDLAAAGVHEVADGLGDGGLAVAGRAVDEDRLAADDGGADRVEQLVADDEVAEGGPHGFGRHVDGRHRLAVDLFDVVFQRHRGGADVGAHLHGFLGAAAAQLGEVEAVADAADQVAAQHFDGLLVLEEAERLLDHLERQAEQPGQVEAEQSAARVQGAEDQVVEEADRQARLLQVFGALGASGAPPPSQSRFLRCCIAACSPDERQGAIAVRSLA